MNLRKEKQKDISVYSDENKKFRTLGDQPLCSLCSAIRPFLTFIHAPII
jgi:hypothetical protein